MNTKQEQYDAMKATPEYQAQLKARRLLRTARNAWYEADDADKATWNELTTTSEYKAWAEGQDD